MLSEPNISYKPFWGICRPLNSWRANSPNPIQIYCAKNYRFELVSGDVFTILDRRENETLKKPYIKEEPKKQEEVKKSEEPKKSVEPKHEDKKQSKVPTGVLLNTSINFILLSLSVVGIGYVVLKNRRQ